MIHLRLADDNRMSAPQPIPFPGRSERSERSAPGRGGPGRSAGGVGSPVGGRFAPLTDEPSISATVDAAFDRVQKQMDELFELSECENPLPIEQWRRTPDDGPSAA